MKLLKLPSGSYIDLEKITFVYVYTRDDISLYFVGDSGATKFTGRDAHKILAQLNKMIEKQEAAAQ